MTKFNRQLTLDTIEKMLDEKLESHRIFTEEPHVMTGDEYALSDRYLKSNSILLLGSEDDHFRRCDDCRVTLDPRDRYKTRRIMAIYGYGNLTCSECIKNQNVKFDIFE